MSGKLPLVFFPATLFLLLSLSPARAEESAIAQPATRTVTLTAYTRADRVMTLVSEVSAKVLAVNADVGDAIGPDQVFATLDATFVRLDLEKNAVERSRLESNISYFAKEAGRYRDLVTRESAAQATLDKLELDLDQARQALDSLLVEQRRLEETLARHTVSAPAGWKVLERHIEPGEWINMGQTLAKLGDFNTLVAPFALAPAEYEWLKQQAGTIRFRLPRAGKTPLYLDAALKQISPAFDPETRKIHVEFSLAPDNVERREGIRVELDMLLPDESGAVLVPDSFVSQRYGEYFLTRENRESVKVVLLGPGPDGNSRVSSPEVRSGDRFVSGPDAP